MQGDQVRLYLEPQAEFFDRASVPLQIQELLDEWPEIDPGTARRDRRKVGGQAATAIGGCGSLAGRNFCPKPVPSVPL